MENLKKKFYSLDDKTQRAFIVLGCIVLITLVVLLSSISRGSENFNNIKQDKGNYLVYSKLEQQDDKYPKYVPYINIKSDIVKQVNNEIDEYVDKYINEEKASVLYEYNINGIILSVVVKIIDYKEEYAPEIYFRTYNINLESLNLISDESLLDFFQTNETQISQIIENQFKGYYNDLVDQGYYEPSECDYECFLSYRSVENYTDNLNYYVKNGNLIAFKPFIFYSIFNDEEYFKSEHFEFLLVETDKN